MRIFQHATFDYWRVPMAKQNCCWMLQVKVGSMSRNQITQYRYSSSVVKLDNKQSASIRNVIINGSKTMMPKWYSCLWHFVNPPCTEKRSGAYANFESGSGKTINHVYKCSNPKKRRTGNIWLWVRFYFSMFMLLLVSLQIVVSQHVG
jgi:hypothetical protein